MTDKLLPCPFCGGRAERPTPEAPHGGMVQCSSCGASAFGPKWNRRTPAPKVNLMPLISRIAAVSIWQDHYPDGPDNMAGTITLTPQDVRDCRSAVAATEGSAK
jgi:hypothetical protein